MQMKRRAERISQDINRTQKRSEKARRSHIKTRIARLKKMGYDLSGYTGGCMLIRRL